MHIQVFHLLSYWNNSNYIHRWITYLHLIMLGLLQKSFTHRGMIRTLYLKIILSHNDLFVPSLTYILVYELYVQKHHFSKWHKYTWIVSIIYLSTLYDIFKFKILTTIYSIECYIISNIPSTVTLLRLYEMLCHNALSKNLPH